MPATQSYCLTRIQFPGRSWQAHWPALAARLATGLPAQGAALWGAFSGLFGIASNELLLATQAPSGDPRPNAALGEARIVEQYLLEATARPASSPAPLNRGGVYVFRFFDVDSVNVGEIVRLSREAWTTFENTSDYASEPLGLFAPADRSTTHARMVLLTWYDGFDSWEKSRTPAPAAREHFARRHELTHGTIAFATALVGSV